MHDPMTLAFTVPYPWVHSRQPDGRAYRAPFITVWHRDPERGGSDDSCGWSFPRLTKEQRRRLCDWAFDEGRNPYFLREPSKAWTGSRTEAETLYRALVLLTARCLGLRMTFGEASLYAAQRVHNGGVEDASGALCWLPGYHCNGEDSPEKRREHLAGIMGGIARDLLRMRRPWWRHPRWHVHHWRLQVHPLQQFKRWAFSRCAGCGRRFPWGYAPTTTQWDGEGPRWFRGERHTYHGECVPSPKRPDREG